MNTTDRGLEHKAYCLPRPGDTEPRIETYLADRYGADNVVIAHPRVTRCVECGEQRVDG